MRGKRTICRSLNNGFDAPKHKLLMVGDMSGGFDSRIVANNVLERAFRDRIPVSLMKLQKICYFTASEYARQTDGARLFSECFVAWQYGPVLRGVDAAFRCFGGGPIRRYACDAAGQPYVLDESCVPGLASVLDRVWERTKDHSAVVLARATRLPGSAWHRSYTANGGGSIDHAAVVDDCTYRALLGFEQPGRQSGCA